MAEGGRTGSGEGRGDAGRAGFTLVEMLVSLALAALIGLLLLQTLKIASGASGAVGRVVAAEEVQSVRDHLRRTLGSLARRRMSGRRPAFEGRPDGLTAVIAPDAGADRTAETRVVLTAATHGGPGFDLVESRAAAEGGSPTAAAQRSEVLLAGLAGLSLRYFGAPAENAPPVWQAQWTRPDRPPKLVEIRLSFDPADRRRWTPLLVALGDRP